MNSVKKRRVSGTMLVNKPVLFNNGMKHRGFTVIELIVTITIMAILLILGVVNMRGSQANARDAERQTDVNSIATSLETFYVAGSEGITTCPDGFIIVPGSSTYGTSTFCAMKYEAKNDGYGKAVSTAYGTPWTYISQVNMLTTAASACSSGCHLMTNAERLTIAQNLLSVSDNWYGGVVGNNFIYQGHSDGSPNYSLEASENDSNGYYGTGDSSSDTLLSNGVAGQTQRRTLTLNNGEVIWDFAGNVYDITSETVAANTQPGYTSDSTFAYREWNDSSLLMHGLSETLKPSYALAAASGWTTVNGIGDIYSYYSDSSERIYRWGGDFGSYTHGGLYILRLNSITTDSTSKYMGFRVTYTSSKAIAISKYGRYPSTYLIDKEATLLYDTDEDIFSAPGESGYSLVAATNNTQTTAGVSPQPTVDQYIYQPLTSDGALCNSEAEECTKFNIYYRLESDNTVYKVTSKNQ